MIDTKAPNSYTIKIAHFREKFDRVLGEPRAVFVLALDCGFWVGVARERNRVGPFVRLERSGRRFEPIRKVRGLSQNRALF